MIDYRELNALAKDPARGRRAAQFLLKLPDTEWTEWELDFLEGMASIEEELSTRQAEKLIEIRDNSIWYEKVEGFSFKTLIHVCWLNRHDLHSDHDVEFIQRLKDAATQSLRKSDAMRLMRCARELREIEPHQGWTFVVPALRAL